jgi:hypothetical protein
MKKISFVLTLLLTILTFASCGGGGGGGSDNPPAPQEEQDTTGTNDNDTGGNDENENETPSCLTERQREDIRSFMNRLVDLGTIQGSGTFGNDVPMTEDFTVTRVSESSWQMNGGACSFDETTGEVEECETTQTDIEFRDGCFWWGTEERARLRSTSSRRLSFVSEGTSGVWTISGTKVTYRQSNGRRFESF